jgi:hypothetical protein
VAGGRDPPARGEVRRTAAEVLESDVATSDAVAIPVPAARRTSPHAGCGAGDAAVGAAERAALAAAPTASHFAAPGP